MTVLDPKARDDSVNPEKALMTQESEASASEAPLPGAPAREPTRIDVSAVTAAAPQRVESRTVFECADVDVYYTDFRALRDVTLDVAEHEVTALIGPSGCGKSTFLRCFNRMNDLIEGARVEGTVNYYGVDLYQDEVDPVEVRRRVGMVFQKPNPFPKSIYDNVAYGPRLAGVKRSEIDDVIEGSLTRAALWDEVKDRLKMSAYGLSGGQQQRLCIARAIAVQPDVVLMDEPCSALDPIATGRIEELIAELKTDYTIIIVTHNMQQAARISDMTAFFSVQANEMGQRTGELVEYAPTSLIFTNPDDPRTEAYITGRVG